MPIRTIKLKIYLDKQKPENIKALWTTHKMLNDYAAKLTRTFLLCRGMDYYTESELIKKEAINKEALEMARAVQKKNIGQTSGKDKEILNLLRKFYKTLIPSAATDEAGFQKQGDAQTTTGFLGVLMSASTRAMQEEYPEYPEWAKKDIKKFMEEEKAILDEIRKDAGKWFQSDAIQKFIKKQKKPGWVTLRETNDPKWMLSCKRYFESIKEKAEAIKTVKEMRNFGLLPLIAPEFSIRLSKKTLTAWEKTALRAIAAQMLSWETWNRRQKDEYEQLEKEKNRLAEKIEKLPEYNQLEKYDKERHEQLKTISEITDENPYALKKREIRSLRQFIENEPDKMGYIERKGLIDNMQSENRKGFGDPEFYNWLIKDENIDIIKKEIDGRNIIEIFTDKNLVEIRLRNSISMAKMCLPDAIKHPKWIMYGYWGDANLKNYRLSNIKDNRRLLLDIPLVNEENGVLEEKRYEFGIEISKQFYRAKINNATEVNYFSNKRQNDADLRSMEIIFSREEMETRNIFADAFIKLALDVKIKMPELLRKIPIGPLSEADKFPAGTRIMGIHPETKIFAMSSIFEIEREKPEKGTYFKLENGNYLAMKEISSIKLKGETPSSRNRLARREYFKEGFEISRKINLLKQIAKLKNIEEPKKREENIKKLDKQINTETLKKSATSSMEKWQDTVTDEFRWHEHMVSIEFEGFRRRQIENHKSKKIYSQGASLWNIKMLEDMKNLLRSWTWNNKTTEQLRPEKFCKKLLAHIKNVKNYRIKTGSSMIVQKAAGKNARNKPCHLIVIEDPSTSFSTGKSKASNRNSMAMCWKSVITQIEMQAELYGIKTYKAYPSYCSMFSIGGIPGAAVETVTGKDLNSAEIKKAEKEYGTKLKENMTIPASYGKRFMYKNEGRASETTIAAIAAVNIVKKLFRIEDNQYKIEADKYKNAEENRLYYRVKDSEKKDRNMLKTREKYLIQDKDGTSWMLSKEMPENAGKYELETESVIFLRDATGTYSDKNLFLPEKEFWKKIKRELFKTINLLQ